jgi:mono/diheme cytochrome c family protein
MNSVISFRFAGIVTVLFLIGGCSSGEQTYLSEWEQTELQDTYQSKYERHEKLQSQYNSSSESLSNNLQLLYDALWPMHEQMNSAYQQLLTRNQEQYRDNERRMMSGEMGMHMQSHRMGEWYQQLQEIHRRLAQIHDNQGQAAWAEINNQLAEQYQQMYEMLPGLERPTEVPFNDQGNPDILNGQQLYATNCASCHGMQGNGIEGVYPPVVNTDWVTGTPSIPLRVLLHGLEGQINVGGITYKANMPSFSARLSIAEMTAIVNFLRVRSHSSLTPVNQDQAIRIGRNYRNRVTPWNADELRE